MGLMRNEKRLKILNPISGRMVSAADPEVHISRLAHFGSGMGVDLTGLHPPYSAKSLRSLRTRNGTDIAVAFGSHDEGLELPVGILDASRNTIDEAGAPEAPTTQAIFELDHRYPYLHAGYGSEKSIDRGVVAKDINAEAYGPHGLGHKERWGENTGLSHRDAAQRTRNVFRQLAAVDRRVPRHGGLSSEARDLLTHGLANPDPGYLAKTRRNAPNHLGAQFVKVEHSEGEIPFGDPGGIHDMIDLTTGTWAKIHPDEYFPD